LVSQLGSGGTEGIEVKGVDLGDIDNDGDLDIVTGGLVDEIYTVHFSNQASVVKNEPPSPPTTFQVKNDDGKLVLRWGDAADAETEFNALTYNLRIGNEDNSASTSSNGGGCFFSPMNN
jgi:hypothetical protein